MRKTTKITFIISGISIGMIIGLVVAARFDFWGYPIGAADTAYDISGTSFEHSVEAVARVVGPAVVSISAERTEKISGPRMRRYNFGGSFEDDFFRKFFEDFFGEMPEREYKQSGLGSGVLIDKEGYILTNEHVVEGADKITVTLPDAREFKAEVKGKDKRSDLAVIKIQGANFPAAKLGDSDALRIGQWVVAIGNPFGFALANPEPTVTSGVVSALHRSLGRIISGDRDYGDLIQTDAAINPGNSGGPLVNLKGEVIGINVAIFSTSGGYQGIGFAVPINSAKRVVSKLIEGKKIVYGWLGVTVQGLDEKLANYFGLIDKKGVLVAKVSADSPAQKSGIKEGDVLLKFDNLEINNVNALLKIVGNIEAGRKVRLDLIRDKKPLTLDVEIGARPENLEELSESALEEEPSDYWRGLRVREITPELAKRFGVSRQEGVLVVELRPDSEADQAGLIRGDVILEINKSYIDNIAAYKNTIKQLSGDVLVRTARGYFILKESSTKQQ
jgi:serine protease Do